MSISRRELLKGAAAAGAALAATSVAEAREKVEPSPDAVGMLFDSTRCVGCRACQTACKVANELPADAVDGERRRVRRARTTSTAPRRTSSRRCRPRQGPVFVKQQCMHCVDPSCVSACMLGRAPQGGRGRAEARRREEGHRHRRLRQADLRRLPLLPDRLRVQRPQVRVVRGVPAHREVRAVPPPRRPEGDGAARRREPRLLRGLPARGGGVREPRGAPRRGEAARSPPSPTATSRTCTASGRAAGRRCSTCPRRASRSSSSGSRRCRSGSAAQFSESVSHAPYLHGVTPIALYAAMAFVIDRNKKKEAAGARRGGEVDERPRERASRSAGGCSIRS